MAAPSSQSGLLGTLTPRQAGGHSPSSALCPGAGSSAWPCTGHWTHSGTLREAHSGRHTQGWPSGREGALQHSGCLGNTLSPRAGGPGSCAGHLQSNCTPRPPSRRPWPSGEVGRLERAAQQGWRSGSHSGRVTHLPGRQGWGSDTDTQGAAKAPGGGLFPKPLPCQVVATLPP